MSTQLRQKNMIGRKASAYSNEQNPIQKSVSPKPVSPRPITQATKVI